MTPPVEIPFTALSDAALTGLIEEFVTRDGTDYGFEEVPLATKMQQLRLALQRGDARIFFDEESQSVQIISRQAQYY